MSFRPVWSARATRAARAATAMTTPASPGGRARNLSTIFCDVSGDIARTRWRSTAGVPAAPASCVQLAPRQIHFPAGFRRFTGMGADRKPVRSRHTSLRSGYCRNRRGTGPRQSHPAILARRMERFHPAVAITGSGYYFAAVYCTSSSELVFASKTTWPAPDPAENNPRTTASCKCRSIVCRNGRAPSCG